jgi:hypothetical protein
MAPLKLLRRLVLALLTLLPVLAVAEPTMSSAPTVDFDRDWTPPPLPDGWTTVGGPGIVVHGAADDLPLLRTLSRHADAALPRLAHELGVPIGGDVHVLLAGTADEFTTLQPGAPPTWADATAYPATGAVFLRHPALRRGTDRPLEQVLDHELVHVLLGRAFQPVPVPHWLQEGVAQVYAGETGLELPARIRRGALGGALFTLEQLEQGFPQDPQRADLAYAQSADFVQWLRVTWGEDAVRDLVRRSREGSSLSVAVHRITGRPLREVEAAWHDRLVATTPIWTAPEHLDALLWGGAAVAILTLGLGRRRAIGGRIAAWRARDAALGRLAREVLVARHARGDASDPG